MIKDDHGWLGTHLSLIHSYLGLVGVHSRQKAIEAREETLSVGGKSHSESDENDRKEKKDLSF